MLLIGIWISFTKNPMNPIIAKPIAVAMAIFWNSTDHTIRKTSKYINITSQIRYSDNINTV